MALVTAAAAAQMWSDYETTLFQRDATLRIYAGNGAWGDGINGHLRPHVPDTTRLEALAFLQELCTLAKTIPQPHNREAFFEALAPDGGKHFFPLVEALLARPGVSTGERVMCCSVISAMLDHDPSACRHYLVQHGRHPSRQPGQAGATGALGAAGKGGVGGDSDSSSTTETEGGAGDAASDSGTFGPMVAAVSSASSSSSSSASAEEGAEEGASEGKDDADAGEGAAAGDGKGGRRSDGTLLQSILSLLVREEDLGVQTHACELLKTLLNSESMDPSEKDTFLSVWYENYMAWIVEPFAAIEQAGRGPVAWHVAFDDLEEKGKGGAGKGGAGKKGAGNGSSSSGSTGNGEDGSEGGGGSSSGSAGGGAGAGGDENAGKPLSPAATKNSNLFLAEIFSLCVDHHGYRIKYFLLGQNVMPKILRVVRYKEKHLQLAGIRFARTCIGAVDDFYNRFMVKNNALGPIFEVFKANGPCTNVLNSAVLELLEFIRQNNMKGLLKYVEKGTARWRSVTWPSCAA